MINEEKVMEETIETETVNSEDITIVNEDGSESRVIGKTQTVAAATGLAALITAGVVLITKQHKKRKANKVELVPSENPIPLDQMQAEYDEIMKRAEELKKQIEKITPAPKQETEETED